MSLNKKYLITEYPDFHLLQGESIHSMLGLKDNNYMVSVFSGTLQIVDIDAQTNNIYSHNHKGTSIQSLVPFPEFNEEHFPLVLIKE